MINHSNTKMDLMGTQNHLSMRPKRSHHKKMHFWNQRIPRVLIVDDDPSIIAITQLIAMNLNVRTSLAFDGKKALDQLRSSTFDLVLLDYYMPELNGKELLDRISDRSTEDHHRQPVHLPVIFYSSRYSPLEIINQQEFYILDYWLKPMTMPTLTSQFAKALTSLGLL